MIEQQQNAPKRLASETMNSLAFFPLNLMDSNSGFNDVFLYRYISQISFYFPMRLQQVDTTKPKLNPVTLKISCKLLSQR